MGNISKFIISGLYGACAFVISLALYPEMVGGADAFFREFVSHCEVGGETTVQVHNPKDNPTEVAVIEEGTSSACKVTGLTSATGVFYTENNKTFGTATSNSITGIGKWVALPSSISDFASINKLLLSLTPLLITVGFLGAAFASIWKYTMGDGSGGLIQSIVMDVGVLIGGLTMIYISPTVMTFIVDAAGVSEGGTLSVTQDFGAITELLYSIMPVGLVLAIIGLVTSRGASHYMSFRKGEMGG